MNEAAFAVLYIKGETSTARLIEGPLPPEKIYDQGLQSQGYRKGGYEGLPRMAECDFTAAYPFGQVSLSDPASPLHVRLTGWSPFIPVDDVNSSIPCAIAEYQISNTSDRAVEFEFSFHLSHLAGRSTDWTKTRNRAIPGVGAMLYNVEEPLSEFYGSASLSVVGHTPLIKSMWMRAGWFGWIGSLWRELSTGTFRTNSGNVDRSIDGHNGASILMPGVLAPGATVTYPIVITWHFPNVHLRSGTQEPAQGAATTCCDNSGMGCSPAWRPYYVKHWNDAGEVAAYVRANYSSLRSRTLAFRTALAASTVPLEVLDAVSSNLAILKSPTVLRQENGNVWAWEGCGAESGCCPGSCTHVWNYGQALPHLFPALEQTLREQELIRSMDAAGHVDFRAALPDGPTTHQFHAAADGQLGGVMKLCRDWQINGSRDWLARLYPLAKRSLEYCIEQWDPQRAGALSRPHHNTYDIEFWGPDSMCQSMYVGALSAMAQLARAVSDPDARSYQTLAENAAAFMDAELFNGEYFHQKVVWNPQSIEKLISERMAGAIELDVEELAALREEGPPYQYGDGCLSDSVIGAWMSRIYGIPSSHSDANTASTLAAIFAHNFKSDLREHACTGRPGYAIGREAGLLVCTWPRGPRPTIPLLYCDEVFSGIEYQVASHMFEEGMVDEGLTIVRAVRSRYDGRARNPFNEYECGSYYARALASYSLLNSLSGFRYSAVERTLWIGPKLPVRPWRSFFSTATAFGVIVLHEDAVSIELLEGHLDVRRVVVTDGGVCREIPCRCYATAEAISRISLTVRSPEERTSSPSRLREVDRCELSLAAGTPTPG